MPCFSYVSFELLFVWLARGDFVDHELDSRREGLEGYVGGLGVTGRVVLREFEEQFERG
jgi:hypothetical protein